MNEDQIDKTFQILKRRPFSENLHKQWRAERKLDHFRTKDDYSQYFEEWSGWTLEEWLTECEKR